MIVFKTDEKITVENYPYGRLQCKATFSLEFKEAKGYRTVRQTINPKTGRINNPKKSTYRYGSRGFLWGHLDENALNQKRLTYCMLSLKL